MSAFCNWDEIGTTNRSPAKEPCPITTAGRTLRLLKSVNGIGKRMTSPVKKLIENVVRLIVPRLSQSFFRQPQPGFAIVRVAALTPGLNRDQNLCLLLQWQRLGKLQHPILVNCFDCGGHSLRISLAVGIGKGDCGRADQRFPYLSRQFIISACAHVFHYRIISTTSLTRASFCPGGHYFSANLVHG